MRNDWIVVAVIVMVVAVVCVAWAQEPAASVQFTDRLAVRAAILDNADRLLDYIEEMCPRKFVDALELHLVPVATTKERRAGLDSVKARLIRLGFAVDDAVVKAVDVARTDLEQE